MQAHIKRHSVVWTCQNPAVWGGEDFVKGWKNMTPALRKQYVQEFAAKVFEVKSFSKNRRCVLCAGGFGASDNYGRGPLRVRHDDLVLV